MVVIERTSDPVRLSYVTAMLAAEGIACRHAGGTVSYVYATRPSLHEVFVAKADAPAARALLRALDAGEGGR